METIEESEKSHLIDERTYSLKQKRSVPGPRLGYPIILCTDREASDTVELRTVGQHCHGNQVASREGLQKTVAKNKLYMASFICLVFMIGEVVGGYLAHSLAIMTDAAHLLTDFGSMLVSLFSLWVSSRPPTKTMSFGWHRSEILGALVSVMSIWIVTGFLLFLAVQRLVERDYEINGHVMLVTSGCAVGVNLIMASILHQSHSSHGHTHGSGYHRLSEGRASPTPSHAESYEAEHGHSHAFLGGHGNTSVRAAFIHVVGDLLQSIGVLVAAIIIYFQPEYKIADPLCTFLFSVFVLGTTVSVLKDVIRILMEGVPYGVEFNAVKEALLSVKTVKGVHNLHLWVLTQSHPLLSAHLAIEPGSDPQNVLQEATALLQTSFGFSNTTIQLELYSQDMDDCAQCQDPTD